MTDRLPSRNEVWDVIATVRDRHPRDKNDAPTDNIIDALILRGFLPLASESSEQGPGWCHMYDCPEAPRGSNGVTVVHERRPSCASAVSGLSEEGNQT
jgi:hypothetical protein